MSETKALKFESTLPDELAELILAKWLEGLSDRDIGRLPEINRSERAIRGQRYKLGITPENYPDRKPLHGRHCYTPDEEVDILTSYNNGASIRSIAERYRVSDRTIDVKITQLLLRQQAPKVEATSRTCLRCSNPFLSKLPKSINRICITCRQEADWGVMI